MMLKMAANQGENELLSELKTERIEVPARDAMKEPPKTAGAAQPTSGPHAGAATAKADGPGSTAKDDPGDGNEAAEDDVAMTFPQRLMEILDNEANNDIIAWLHHGRGFVIFRKKAFEQKILPKYFSKQSKYSSFTRKLNRWGFTRVTRNPEAGAYYHQFFQRGGHRLLLQMSCQSGNKGMASASSAAAAAASIKDPSSPSYINLAAAAGGSPSAAAAAAGVGSISPTLRPMQFGLQQEQLALQQHQQLLQYQIQQQLLQQEAARRALLASQSRFAALQLPTGANLANIPSVSFHQQQQHHDALYSQLVAAQLAQAGLGGGGGAGVGGPDLGDMSGNPAAGPGSGGGNLGGGGNSSLGASFLHWKNFPPS